MRHTQNVCVECAVKTTDHTTGENHEMHWVGAPGMETFGYVIIKHC